MKPTIENIHSMTDREIDQWVFLGATGYEFRSYRDRLGDAVVQLIPQHPAWRLFSTAFRSAIWGAIDAILSEQGY